MRREAQQEETQPAEERGERLATGRAIASGGKSTGVVAGATDVPSQWASFTPLNAERSAALKEGGGNITEKLDPKEGPECKKA